MKNLVVLFFSVLLVPMIGHTESTSDQNDPQIKALCATLSSDQEILKSCTDDTVDLKGDGIFSKASFICSFFNEDGLGSEDRSIKCLSKAIELNLESKNNAKAVALKNEADSCKSDNGQDKFLIATCLFDIVNGEGMMALED